MKARSRVAEMRVINRQGFSPQNCCPVDDFEKLTLRQRLTSLCLLSVNRDWKALVPGMAEGESFFLTEWEREREREGGAPERGPFQRSRIYEHGDKGEPVHIIIIFIARNKCFCYNYENVAVGVKTH